MSESMNFKMTELDFWVILLQSCWSKLLTSRLRDVCRSTEMKWLLWQFKLILVIAAGRIGTVLNHFY